MSLHIANVAVRHDYRRMSDDLIGLNLQHLRATGRAQDTVDGRRIILGLLNNWLPYGLCYAATEQLEAWLAELRERGLSRFTVHNYDYHARSFYSWACGNGYLDGNPMVAIEKPKQPRSMPDPVSEEELARILTLAEPLLTAAVLAAFAGLRRGEISRCRREHISAERIIVPHGKGGDPGTVPTHPYVWQHVRDRPPGLLVQHRNGKRYTPNDLSKEARYALDAIGLPDVHLHRLRHRYGTLIQELYGDLRVTQECLRHRNVRSTEGYTLVTSVRRAAAVTKLPVPATIRKTGPAEL